MSVTTPTDSPRYSRRALLILTLLLAGSLFYTVHPWFDAKNDSSMYVVTARNFLAGEGITYLGEPFTIRPPGFTVMLAAVIAVFGDTWFNFNLFVSVWGVLLCALLFWHQRTRLGVPLAFLTSITLWLNPWFQHLCTEVLSDVPGIALMLACLLFDRLIRGRERPSVLLDLALALCIGASCYVRTACILLVPAITLARLTAHVFEHRRLPGLRSPLWLSCLVIGVLPFLVQTPWNQRNAAARTDEATEQTHIHSYSVAMWHADPGDPGSERLTWSDVLGRIPKRGHEALTTVGSRMRGVRQNTAPLVVGALFMLCSVITFVRRRGAFDFLQLGTFCVVAIYFAYKPRLALPLFVFALPQAVDTIRFICGRFVSQRLAILVTVAALLGLLAVDFAPRQGWDAIKRRHESFTALAHYVDRKVGEERVLAMPQGWHLNAYTGRRCYSLLPSMMRKGGKHGFVVIEKHGIDWYAFNKPKPSHVSTWRVLKSRYRIKPTPLLADWAVVDMR